MSAVADLDVGRIVRLTGPTGAMALLRERGVSTVDAEALVDEHLDTEAKPPDKFAGKPANGVKVKPIKWLWHPWLPLGRLTVIYGEEGIGKGLVAADIAARATLGALDNSEPTNVEWVTFEDADDDVLVPRLIAAGADLDQIKIHDADDNYESPLVLPDDVSGLAAAMLDRGSKLLVIDPLSDALREGLKDNNNADVRRGLVPLQEMARDLGVAVLGVLRPNKGSTRAADKVMGSKAWRSVPRSVFMLSRDPDDEQGPGRVMCLTKTNGAARKISITAKLESVDVPAAGSQGHIVFGDECDWTDNQLTVFAATGHTPGSKPKTKSGQAEDLLLRLMNQAGGRIPIADAVEAAKTEEISASTLKRARQALKFTVDGHDWVVPDDWKPPLALA